MIETCRERFKCFYANFRLLKTIYAHLLVLLKYSVIKKYGLDFVRLYFLNYTRYENDLHNI